MQITGKLAKCFIALTVLAGMVVLVRALTLWQFGHHSWFLYLAILSVFASRLRVSLPGVNGSMSVNLPFILLALSRLSFSEAILIAGLSTFAQCLPKPGKQIKLVQTIFNVSNIMNATGLGFLAARGAMNGNLLDPSLLIGLAGVTFFLAETVPVAAVISLTEHKSTAKIWRELFVLTSPYFFLSAGVAATAVAALQHAGWSIPTLTLILMYSTYRSFRAYFHPLAVGVPVPSGARSMSAAAGR
jgi:hypothetical protein